MHTWSFQDMVAPKYLIDSAAIDSRRDDERLECWEESKEGRFRALMQVTSGSAERSVTRHVGIMTPFMVEPCFAYGGCIGRVVQTECKY